ncbi:protein kinase domain-containing protein [Actinoplanes teichomyceticus]|uniref:protein kinase domain-containing protein n=1 Tax=Actinoplanes teichomyceticus TaxID=1867 RepID=UPI001EF20AAF|nr:protein kinase [Actinoplanes teichomyceticus]
MHPSGADERSRLDAVRRAGRGSRRDYALDPRPIARGGQATVHGAVHKPTGVRVAFKKAALRDRHSLARMRREIEAARLFGDHPHVMPVLDASPAHDWFVMPLACGTARTLAAGPADPASLRELITAICDALREPHRRDWIHRDLKPDNILRFDRRWVVADWGLGRRPRGTTTDPARTRVGGEFGTAGFAAPELAVNAHLAGAQADVFSIGQIVGWACTGRDPQPNVPLLPPSGPWRIIAKAATAHDPARRPDGVDGLLALIAAEFDPEPAAARAARLTGAIRDGDGSALVELFSLAGHAGDDHARFFDSVVDLPADRVRAAVAADPATAAEVVRSAPSWYAGTAPSPARRRRVVTWLLTIAGHAAGLGEWDLLEDAVDSALHLDAAGAAADAGGAVRAWLSAQSGQAASIAAVSLRRHPEACARHTALIGAAAVDHRIREAVRAAAATHPAAAGPPVPDGDDAARDDPPGDGPTQGDLSGDGPTRGGPSGDVARGDSPGDGSGRDDPAGGRRSEIVVVAVIGVVAAALAVTIPLLDEAAGDQPGGRGSGAGASDAQTGLPRRPTELADTPQFKNFVKPWDQYPAWVACRTGSGDTLLNGSFPARRAEPEPPVHSLSCGNGGNLTVMFAEFRPGAGFAGVSQRYLSAPAAEHPVGTERTPPSGTHVFQWSATHRALVWTDREAQTIGVVTTDSPAADLVEIWSRYRA